MAKVRRIAVDSQEAERAFAAVGGIPDVPWDVFGPVLRDQSVHRKALYQVADASGAPVLVPLRHRPPFWEPLLTGVYPDAPVGIGPGDHLDALAQLGGPMRLRYLRSLPPRRVTWARPLDTFAADTTVDPWQRWGREWKNSIRLNRNRMRDFPIHMDRPEDAEWMFRTWADRWREPRSDAANWPERAAMQRHFTAAGRVWQFAVEADDGILAAVSTLAVGPDLWFWTIARRPSEAHRRLSPGSLLIDLMIRRAHTEGFRSVQLGTQFAYKEHWGAAITPLWDATTAGPRERVALAAKRAVTMAATKVAGLRGGRHAGGGN